ncbi:MAG: FkbM family methyltransferase [Acidobacteria bacterium]|nr:FkbM family methyltransferase [Acidobacteriota bacterium]
MKILLVVKQKKNIDTFRRTIACLLERGHEVTVAVQERDEQRDEKLTRDIGHERFAIVACPPARTDQWTAVAALLRSLRDCLHYLRPALRGAVKLQTRTVLKLRQEIQIPGDPEAVAAALRELPPPQVARLEALLKLAEQKLPADSLYDEFIRSHAPDVLLVSPLVHFGSAQADLVASARHVGVPVWMLLFSWDNLSTKGTLHRPPDLMFVWNEQQRTEAQTLHGFPPERVVVVGAPRFDGFFALKPSMTREEFHAPIGLDPARPTVLYVCSSRFVSESELEFVRGWVREVRGSRSPVLQGCNIIVRPHPDVPLLPREEPTEHVRWPAAPELTAQVARPFGDPRAVVIRTAYRSSIGLFESIWHSGAVVGLNTSAELEAGIVGRPVFTIVVNPREADGQAGTLHFHYLLKEHGGFVSAEGNYKHHLSDLGDALKAPPDPAAIRAFIETFLRPHGIDTPVAPLLAEAIERAFDARPGGAAVGAGSGAEADTAGDHTEAPEAPEAPAPKKGADDVVALDVRGLRIHLHVTPEIRRGKRPINRLAYEEVVDWLQSAVGIGDVLYDLGAGIGVYTLFAARHRAALVVAIEAGYSSYARLCENLLLNACDGIVVPLPFALAEADGLREMKYRLRQQGRDRYTLRNRWRPRPSAAERTYVQPVCATALDKLVERFDLPAPHHVHFSRSTATRPVLSGAADTLSRPSVKSVFMTVDPKGLDGVVEMMQTFGWQTTFRRDGSVDHVYLGFERPATAVGQAPRTAPPDPLVMED